MFVFISVFLSVYYYCFHWECLDMDILLFSSDVKLDMNCLYRDLLNDWNFTWFWNFLLKILTEILLFLAWLSLKLYGLLGQ